MCEPRAVAFQLILERMATKEKDSGQEEQGEVSSTSSLTALFLVVPGIALYVYILYIMVSKLVYPASFVPFSNKSEQPAESSEGYSIGKGRTRGQGYMALNWYDEGVKIIICC